ncbi:hypothetical protein ABK040_005538 [Willaertia magna]
MGQKRNGIKPCHFFQLVKEEDNESFKWKPISWWNNNDSNDNNISSFNFSLENKNTLQNNNIKILQFNVLHDELNNLELSNKISTEKRYNYILNEFLPKENADIICLNEVGNYFLQKLLNLKEYLFKNNYHYITHLDKNNYQLLNLQKEGQKHLIEMKIEKGDFINLIISKIPFSQCHLYYYQNKLVYSKRPCLLVTLNNGIIITNLHLKAFKECFEIRKKQLKCLFSLFKIKRIKFTTTIEEKKNEENVVEENNELEKKEEEINNKNNKNTNNNKKKNNNKKNNTSSNNNVVIYNDSTFHFALEDNLKRMEDKQYFKEMFDNNLIKTIIICGDFNLNHEFEENYISDYDIIDIYPYLHNNIENITEEEKNGFTFNYKENPIVNLFSPNSTGIARYDRILMYNVDSSSYLIPQLCTVIENKPFEESIYASDHYALRTIFKINN